MSDPTPQPTPETPEEETQDDGLTDAPEIPEADQTGRFAVYDRTLGSYVGGVSDKKLSQREADALVPQGHTAAVVKV